MILRNYKKVLATFLASATGSLSITVKNVLGVERTLYANTQNANYSSMLYAPGYCMSSVLTAFSTNGTGVVFGDGTTPVTDDDYTLSGNVISTISASVVVSTQTDDDGIATTAVYTLTNTGSTEITISEVGCVIYTYYGSNSNSPIPLMADRTLLDTPITIEAGGVGRVTYTIRQEW